MAFETAKSRPYAKYLPDGFLLDESFQEPSTAGSRIVDYFNHRHVLVTGATGFLGKLLIEKLLRTCTEIDGIFVVVREKKGKDFNSRLDDIFENPLYDRLRRVMPKFRHKILPIGGDVALPGLGISESDRNLIVEKVSVIFHGAATVRFDEKLPTAAGINIGGTRAIVDLAKSCKNLAAFVHVSTAFTHCVRKDIGERFYDLDVTPYEILEMVKTKDDRYFEENERRIVGNYPNTYAFTKALAENLVRDECANLPACIFRPAIVTTTYSEPLRGWTDNLYGPIGFFIGLGTGVVRCLHADTKLNLELVPADYVINGMIAAAHETGTVKLRDGDDDKWRERASYNGASVCRSATIPVYNYVSSPQNPVGYETMWATLEDVAATPSIRTISYFVCVCENNRFLYLLLALVLHFLPAVVCDAACILMNRKPMYTRLYKKVFQTMDKCSFFTVRNWQFENGNVQRLWSAQNNVDRRLYPFNMGDLSWADCFKYCPIGLRTYMLKEDFSTIPAARKKLQRLYYLHRIMQAVLVLVALKMILYLVQTTISFII